MVQARRRERWLNRPLVAPLLVAVGLAPFVVEVATSPDAPTVALVLSATLVVVGTANAALGLPRLAAATLLVSLSSAVAAVGVATPVDANAAMAGLLAVALGLLAWSVRAGEGDRLRELTRASDGVRERE